jgi:hypothetical protein
VGLVPEFFVVLGIIIFLAMSLLSAFLDDNLPSLLQYLFQIAAIVGVGELLVSQGFVNLTRFWVSIIYLSFAFSSVVGLNIYLGVVHRKIAVTPAYSGAVTVPILMISALFVYSFLGSGGEVVFAPPAIVTLAVLTSLTGLSIFGILREVSKHASNALGGLGSSLTDPVGTPSTTPAVGLPLHLPSVQGEEWEESPKREKGEE